LKSISLGTLKVVIKTEATGVSANGKGLMSRCYKFAIDGNMKAARLFFEATSDKRPDTSVQNQQNNFVQINNLTHN